MKISDKQIVYCTISGAMGMLLTYIICFWGVSISDKTSDWGAFGNYMGMVISSISIALIFITYREQSKSNKIARYEQHILLMIKTLNALSTKYQKSLEDAYCRFAKHFTLSYYDLTQCERDITAGVCSYYYSLLYVDFPVIDDFKYIFRYLELCTDYTHKNKTIAEEDSYWTELICSLPESVRILFFCWVIEHRKELLYYYFEKGLFTLGDKTPLPLAEIIMFVCTGKKLKRRIIEDIKKSVIKPVIEDYSDEQFQDTYNRIHHKLKQKT